MGVGRADHEPTLGGEWLEVPGFDSREAEKSKQKEKVEDWG